MKTSKNTVLITGGSAGIGFEIAKLFGANDNRVIILGRNEARLQQAASRLQNVTAIRCDITDEADLARLAGTLAKDFPELDVVINNAGEAYGYSLEPGAGAAEKALAEMQTNYFSVIRLTEMLWPILARQTEAAVVNVSSIVAFVPGNRIPTYSASKAALHSYTQSLRHTQRDSSVKIFELMPPLVNTDFSKDIGGADGIAPSVVAADLLRAFETDTYEIHVGDTAGLYNLFHSSPADAFAAMNPSVPA